MLQLNSFNAKIKAFRAQFRGVRNIEFFLFRLTNFFCINTTIGLDPLIVYSIRKIQFKLVCTKLVGWCKGIGSVIANTIAINYRGILNKFMY